MGELIMTLGRAYGPPDLTEGQPSFVEYLLIEEDFTDRILTTPAGVITVNGDIVTIPDTQYDLGPFGLIP